MPQLIYDGQFAGPTAANATANSAATDTTGAHDVVTVGTANQLVDVVGGAWDVDSSGVLLGAEATAAAGGSALAWPSGFAATASRVVAWVAAGQPGQVTCQVGVRYSTASGAPAYYAGIFTPSTSAFSAKAVNGDVIGALGAGDLAGTISPAYDPTHAYRLDLQSSAVTSGYITTVTFKVYDDTAGTLVGTLSGDDYSGSLTNPGVPVLAARSSDPAVPVRFTRAQVYDPLFTPPSGPTLTLTSTSHTSAAFGFAGVSGGTPPYDSQLYRSPTSGFTPAGAGTAVGSAAAGASGTLTDPSPPTGLNYYRVLTTDSTTGTALTSLSNEVAAAGQFPPLAIGFVGDSITYGTGATPGTDDTPTLVGRLLATAFGDRTVTVVNRGQPSAVASYWLPGSSSNYYNDAVAAFAAAGVTHVHVMLGTNDSSNAFGHISADAFASDYNTLVADLVAAGYKVVLSYPIFMGTNDPAQYNLIPQYQARIDALVNGVTVFAGDRLGWPYFANHASLLGDGVHPGPTGTPLLADLWFPGFARALSLPFTAQSAMLL